jgi:phosphoribosylaminoimidazole-succinocarboxamide synthase
MENLQPGDRAMPVLSPLRASVPLIPGLELVSRGKVRDTYDLGKNRLLVVATDGLSIFDFVLNALVPDKGMVLTAMNHFWLTRIKEARGTKTHLIEAGAEIDWSLPVQLRRNPELQSRSMVVEKLVMDPIEFVARGYLTGSGLKDYLATGKVCGHTLQAGLEDGDALNPPIDTPTTKAQEGHDLPLDAEEVRKGYPEQTKLTLETYQFLRGLSRQCGFILADTKLEWGRDTNGKVTLGDEVGTPDSSRYWSHKDWQETRQERIRKAPPAHDKQIVREWGITAGVNKLDPLSPDDIKRVHALSVPEEVIMATTRTYRDIFKKITGHTPESYLHVELGVKMDE